MFTSAARTRLATKSPTTITAPGSICGSNTSNQPARSHLHHSSFLGPSPSSSPSRLPYQQRRFISTSSTPNPRGNNRFFEQSSPTRSHSSLDSSQSASTQTSFSQSIDHIGSRSNQYQQQSNTQALYQIENNNIQPTLKSDQNGSNLFSPPSPFAQNGQNGQHRSSRGQSSASMSRTKNAKTGFWSCVDTQTDPSLRRLMLQPISHSSHSIHTKSSKPRGERSAILKRSKRDFQTSVNDPLSALSRSLSSSRSHLPTRRFLPSSTALSSRSPLTTTRRHYQRDNLPNDPFFTPQGFDPYKYESKDYYRYDFDAKYMNPYMSADALKYWRELNTTGTPSRRSFTELMRQQTKVEQNLRRMEDHVHREKVFGARGQDDVEYFDRDYRRLEKRQRFLLNKIYQQQVEAVITEFESDYAPLMAARLRSQKRALFWKEMRHKFRFILYPFSLAINSFFIALKIYDRRQARRATTTPRLITEAEYQHFRYKFQFSPTRWFKNRHRLYATVREFKHRSQFLLGAQRELLIMRTKAAKTEMLRFKKYSGVRNPVQLFNWISRRSKYDPAQYALRKKITSNLKTHWTRPKIFFGQTAPLEELMDKRNPTMFLSEHDKEKLGLRILQKLVIFFRLTGVTYADQPWVVRKLREIIDMYYDVWVPNIYRYLQRFDSTRVENRIDRLIQKEIKRQEKLEKQYFKSLEKAANPNSWSNIKAGIKTEGSLFRFMKNRVRMWRLKRKNATLYDVAAKNRTYFWGAPAGPPFWRVYLQTRHLLKSPFAHQRVQRLTVGQEDAKSFLRKWGEMNSAMARSPKLRSLMIQAFHDNLTIRSSMYFKLSRFLRRKKPIIDKYRKEYFYEIERVFQSIFFKKERYTFQQLYAMSLNEWWYPTQQSIQKFDRFDKRRYDRYDDKDSSFLFSLLTGITTVCLWLFAYNWARNKRTQHENQTRENEKYLYTADGADVSHFIDGLLYADKRDLILAELKYDGIMKLHDQVCSRMGRMLDSYYSVLSDSVRERYWDQEPTTTLVYSANELANIANAMKGKARDLEIVDQFIINKVQSLWCDAAVIYARQCNISFTPTDFPLEMRQEQADIGHFLMSHIDKIAQSATFPEYEGTSALSYVIDNGVLKLKPTETEPGVTHERLMSQDQEERLFKYGNDNPVNKFLALSQAVSYIDHSGDCGIAKLARLENNFELLVQLLDAILEIQKAAAESEDLRNRTLPIPNSSEIAEMYERGTLETFLKEWHIKHHRYLPHEFMPEDFATLKAKQIYRETGDKEIADHFLVYFKKYVEPNSWADFTDAHGNTETEFGLKIDPVEQLLADTEFYEAVTLEQRVGQLFRPHVNLITQNINRLVSLRPLIYKEIKNDFMLKFPWVPDLDKDIEDLGWTWGDGRRMWEASQQWAKYEMENITQGTLGKLDLEYTVPILMARELRNREFFKGNTAPGTYSKALRHLHPKPSEVFALTGGRYVDADLYVADKNLFDPKMAHYERNEELTWAVSQALEWKDEYGITRNPDNWSVVFDQQLWGWDLDELKAKTKAFLQWRTGAIPTMWDTNNVSPTGAEKTHLQITPFDQGAYYDAWTDIYQLNARTKNRIVHERKPKGLTIPYIAYIGGVREREHDDPDDRSLLVNEFKFIGETMRFKMDTYNHRTYGTDIEFWSNRSLFYQRIDRYFHYFKYHLNRQWSKDMLEENSRWKRLKRWWNEGPRKSTWYEDYFIEHGFRHFLTEDPVLARYGNDFFFRYFVDAPRFDRRPQALYDQHRYDKDGEDIYFDALYNTRTLNNPYPLHLEHRYWSLKPWHLFVNAQFAVFRYLIVSDGQWPTEFPQMMQHDLDELLLFIVPDIHYGYDAVHAWGKDLFDTTYKKHVPERSFSDSKGKMYRPNFVDFDEQYRPG